MPILDSDFRPPLWLRMGHAQTVAAHFRKAPDPPYRRERIATPDDDFLDLDWAETGADKLALICHGLEGNSTRAYVRGMATALNQAGWDACAMNYRGCGGEINRALRFYHSGATDDLGTVIAHALAPGRYQRLALVGFSLGGNLLLKYLGEQGDQVHPTISQGVAFSVPCDLASAARQMNRMSNRLYIRRFLKLLHEKVRAKMLVMPGALNDEGYERIRDFHDFDNRYTAPVNGFADADDYYAKASCKPGLKHIRVPCLIVNALDDPLLGPGCYPRDEARVNPHVFLETPAHGGHVGFISGGGIGPLWSERRALRFLQTSLSEEPRP